MPPVEDPQPPATTCRAGSNRGNLGSPITASTSRTYSRARSRCPNLAKFFLPTAIETLDGGMERARCEVHVTLQCLQVLVTRQLLYFLDRQPIRDPVRAELASSHRQLPDLEIDVRPFEVASPQTEGRHRHRAARRAGPSSERSFARDTSRSYCSKSNSFRCSGASATA